VSADAKVWQDDDGMWRGVHDSGCEVRGGHEGTSYDLVDVLAYVEGCENKGKPMRWAIHVYPDGKTGLRGFCV
jgi:hypothetical protein